MKRFFTRPKIYLDFEKRIKRKRLYIFIGVIIAIILLIILLRSSPEEKPTGTQSESSPSIFSGLRQKSSPADSESKEITDLKDLELTVLDTSPGIYTILEHTFASDDNTTIESFDRINKSYYKVNIKIFNPNSEGTITLTSIKLTDNLDNEHFPIPNPDVFARIKEFGADMKISPRTIREGYLTFPGLDEEASQLELTVETSTQTMSHNFDVQKPNQ